MNLGNIAKAVVGALVAGVAPYTAALLPTSQLGGQVSLGEWLTVVVAVLVASAAVWRADNVRWFKYAKATTAAVVTFLGPLVIVFLSGGAPTQTDVLNALVQVVIAFGVVSQVPNAPETEWHDPIGGDGEPDPLDTLHTLGVDQDDNPRVSGPPTRVDYDPSNPDGNYTPVDEDGDGHDDRTGRFYDVDPDEPRVIPELVEANRHRRRFLQGGVIPGGALALILGGAVPR